MWGHKGGCEIQCCCACTIYLLTFLASWFIIIIDREVGAPGNGKYVVDGMNARDKQMLKLEIFRAIK